MKLQLTDGKLLRQQCLIGGAWEGVSEAAVLDPATEREIARVPRFGAEAVSRAVDEASAAFAPWATKLAKERADVLRKFSQLIVANADDLASILTAEQGKPRAEAHGEIMSAAAYIDFFADEARRVHGEVIPAHRADSRIIVVSQPIGVVAAITPWNFPAGMVARKIGPALAAGCTVVLKPAPETPLTALALAELAQRAGLPGGVLNVVTGDAAEIGQALCSHPSVRYIGFTGSTAVGKLLMRQAADQVKKVGLELGGHAPFIVLDDADIGPAVEGALAAKYRNMGQTCVCANRIWLHDRIYAEFVERFVREVEKLTAGHGLEPGVTQGPLINERARTKVERHIADAISKNAHLLLGGERHELGGNFFQPTVLTEVADDMLIAREETFGPVAAITRFDDDEDMVRRVNASEYGLAAYLYGRDLGRVIRIAERLEYGMVGINAVALGTEVAPIGGTKQSGIGREGSHHGISEYCELKYMLVGGI